MYTVTLKTTLPWMWPQFQTTFSDVIPISQCFLYAHLWARFVNADHWRQNMPALAKAGFRVFSIDLLGYGYSSLAAPPHPANDLVAAIHCYVNRFSANIGTKAISINCQSTTGSLKCIKRSYRLIWRTDEWTAVGCVFCKMRCSKLLHGCPLVVPCTSEARNLIHMGRKGARSTGRMDEGQDRMKDMRTRRPGWSLVHWCHFTSLLSPNFAHGLEPEYDMLETYHHLYVSCLHIIR